MMSIGHSCQMVALKRGPAGGTSISALVQAQEGVGGRTGRL